MFTPKQNLLESLKHREGKPACLLNSYTMVRCTSGDPCFKLIRGGRIRGTNSIDPWGTLILFPEDAPAAVPLVTPENQVIKDITQWEKYVKVPDLIGKCSDGWEEAKAKRDAIPDDYVATTIMGTGIFEQLHMLMTFEDTLMNTLLEPEAMQELIDVICEYRLTYMKLICENLHPDMIISHDDWGSKTSLFMSPETWRRLFKAPYAKLYNYLHSQGVIVMHHGDSYMEPIVEDMAEIGVDIWQGVLPTNNIEKISKLVGDKMLLMGGIDSVIDRADASEDEIRIETRRALAEYGGLEGYWPGITYGGPGSLSPHVSPIIEEEIAQYNIRRFGVSI